MAIDPPTPPIRPAPPPPLSPTAAASEIAHHRAQQTRYAAQMRVYETAWQIYQRDLRKWMEADPAATEQTVSEAATPAPEQPAAVSAATLVREAQPLPALEVATAPQPALVPVVTPPEPTAPPPAPILVAFEGHLFVKPADLNQLNLAVNLATSAQSLGVEAGDLRWHGADRDFHWPDHKGEPIPMDAETLIDFARAVFNAT